MRKQIYFRLIILFFIFGIAGCASVNKYIQKERYEDAINLAVNKLSSKGAKSPAMVADLERAYNLAIKRDVNKINYLKQANPKDVDLQIVRIYNNMEDYQLKILPLLPLTDKNGHIAKIDLLDITALRSTHEDQASDYLYSQAMKDLTEGRKGNKMYARDAHDKLVELERISGPSRAITELIEEARHLGTTYILVNPQIGSRLNLSQNTTDLFFNLGNADISSGWQAVDLTPDRKIKYDYEANLVFENYEISPEKENTREYQDTKEIEEDTDRKDREGKVIKKKVTVKADVIEIYQFKEIIATGLVSIKDLKTGKEVYFKDMTAKKTFENYASTYKGDKRALSDVSQKRVGGKPVPFPTNDMMLDDVIIEIQRNLLNIFKKELTKY